MADLVTIERPSDGVVLMRLNRPAALNALNTALRHRLVEVFTELGSDDGVRCIVITGNEKAFVAGADLKEFATMGTAEITRTNVRRLWGVIADCPKPLVAAVNGFALGGGCELAMHADIIIAGENARFGQPEVRVGIMAGGGGTQRLVRAVGKFKAMKMLLTGEPVSGREAFDMGLASEVVADDKVVARALEIAATVAAMPALAIRRTKEVVLAGQDTSLAAGLMLERRAFDTLFDTEDQKEGMQAFLEKRKPEFKGR
jgi:enoyl-CoA hydratase/carnithine racemase